MNAIVEGLFTFKKTVSQFGDCDGFEDCVIISIKESQLICLEVFLFNFLLSFATVWELLLCLLRLCTEVYLLRVASIKVQIIKTLHGYVHTNRNWTLKKLTFVDSLKSTNQMLEMGIVLQWLSNRVSYHNCLHQIKQFQTSICRQFYSFCS